MRINPPVRPARLLCQTGLSGRCAGRTAGNGLTGCMERERPDPISAAADHPDCVTAAIVTTS